MIYILKNLKSFIKNNTFIFVLFLLCQFVSVFVMFFSYGIIHNYSNVQKEEVLKSQIVEINFDESIKLRDLKKVINRLGNDVFTPLDRISIMSFYNGIPIVFNMEYDNGLTFSKDVYYENIEPYLFEGRIFTEEEYRLGKNVAIISLSLLEEGQYEYLGTIQVFDNEYKIIGIEEDSPQSILIPYISAPDELDTIAFVLNYKYLPTRAHFLTMRDNFLEVFGDNVNFPEFQTLDVEEISFFNTISLTAIVIGLLASVNLAVLFRYILSTRRKTLAIFRMGGCTKGKATATYIAEILMISLPVFFVVLLFFDTGILPLVDNLFPHMVNAFSPLVYLFMFIVYTGVVCLVLYLMILRFVSRSPVSLFRGGER